MKCNFARTTCLALLVLCLAAVAQAQDQRCTNPGLVGAWAYTETGTLIAPTVPTPTAMLSVVVGRYTFDADGTFTGTQASSTAGQGVGHETKEGTYTLNDDCTGILTLTAYRGVTKVRESVWEIVLADNAMEMQGILVWTKAYLPDGRQPELYPLMTLAGKRLFRDRGSNAPQ